jgi:predicted nucleic-acid-binding Zn-ribbon protein
MVPKCPKCGCTLFSLEELSVQKSDFRIFGVCCSACGAVVGVKEFYDNGDLIHKLARRLNVDLKSS